MRRSPGYQALSRTYQLGSETPPGGRDDPGRYTVAALKPLSPEALARSLMQATGQAEAVRRSQGAAATEESVRKALDVNIGPFVQAFSSGVGAPQSFHVRMDHALFLANGAPLRLWFYRQSGNLTDRLAALKTAEEVAEELYLSTLTRLPEQEERQEVADHLALVRSMNTLDEVHYNGAIIMHTGRPPVADIKYPHFGSVCAKLLAPEESPLPGYLHITTPGPTRPDGPQGVEEAAFLGPRYASVMLPNGREPRDLALPESLSEPSDRRRQALRVRANERFARRRRTAETEAFAESHEQAAQLKERRRVFDLSQEDPRIRDRYGMHEFGQNCLLGRS